jgi:hypothetical protein
VRHRLRYGGACRADLSAVAIGEVCAKVEAMWGMLEGGGDRELGADDGFDAGSGRSAVKAGGAVHAIAIEQGNGRISEARRLVDEGFGQGCGF